MLIRSWRFVAAAAAGASALLYYLIGLGVLNIGQSTSGEDPGLLGFGLMAGSTFLVAGLLVLLVQRRWLLALVAVLDVLVIIGYFAVAGVRNPPFEIWGLLVKICQLALLAALSYLLLHESAGERAAGAGPMKL